MTPTPRSTFLLPLILAATLIGSRPTPASSEPRGVLTFRGSVLDPTGKPIREAWVVSLGSRRSGTLVDPTGHFVLPIRGDLLAELSRQPFTLRIQARHKGWVITLPDGSQELGLEIAVVTDGSGAGRLEVRSNQPEIAAAVAGGAVLDAGGNLDFELRFLGVPGTQPEYTDPAPLTSVEQVSLVGIAGVERSSSRPAATSVPAAVTAAPTTAAPTAAPTTAVPTTAAPATAAPTTAAPTTAAPAMAAPPMAVPIMAAPISIDPVETPGPGRAEAAREDSTSGAVAKSTGRDLAAPALTGGHPVDRDDAALRPESESVDVLEDAGAEAEESDSLLVADLDPVAFEADSALEEVPPPPVAADVPVRSHPRITILPIESPREPVASPAPSSDPAPLEATRAGNDAARSGPATFSTPTSLASPITARSSQSPSASAAGVMDSEPVIASAPADKRTPDPIPSSAPAGMASMPATPIANAAGSVTAPSTETAIVAPPPANGSPNTETIAVMTPVEPPRKPERKPRRGTIVASVVSAPATTPQPSANWPTATLRPGAATVTECQSRIQGTVEVESERPLQGRTQVTVYLEDDPLVTDTVELFMGSPRGFELQNVPCGPHRLKFEIRSKHRFELISAEPRVDCSGGGLRQTRIVLQPIAGRRLVP